MIIAATVEGFRGLRRLKVEGFGRVNLVIGKNDCGKTALLETLLVTDLVENAAHALVHLQGARRSKVPPRDFERFWTPLFWNQDAERGLSMTVTKAPNEVHRLVLRKAKPLPDLVTDDLAASPHGRTSWAMSLQTTREGRAWEDRISATSAGLKLPSGGEETSGAWWIAPTKSISAEDIGLFSSLKQGGREAEFLDLLREIDARVTGVELLAPTGSAAELFVRLGSTAPLLPMAMMGDGFQRCFEIGVAAIVHPWPALYIDEFDNGLHHSTLEPVWRWLATISIKRGLQVFATTHSEECIQAACRAFTAANDDGLRVIRLDQREEETVATIYDRALVEAAAEMSVEIRG